MLEETTASIVDRLPDEPYFRPSYLGPDCSTPRSAHLRERRVQLSRLKKSEPAHYTQLAMEARRIYLENEVFDPSIARAKALRYIVERCDVEIMDDTLLLGGENSFFFNLMYPALVADKYGIQGRKTMDETGQRLDQFGVFGGPCFDGHITPGLEYILSQGIAGFRKRIEEYRQTRARSGNPDPAVDRFYEAALMSCESVLRYTELHRVEAERLARETSDKAWAQELSTAAAVLERVPLHPAETFREALQSYFIVYVLVTLEMGGCVPGGGLGLGRLDQFLYPYYARDLREGRLTRPQALELMEQFLLSFCHENYYTPHQKFTVGSQSSLGGITPAGQDGFNDLTELIMEASLRINMPAPYLSLRLYKNAPERFWQTAANYIASGLGFPVVNDEALIPAMLRHERSLGDARDYICSCCYEHTIPGREAFHPSCVFVNLPLLLELALNQGHSVLNGELLGAATPPAERFASFDEVLNAFYSQVHQVFDWMVAAVNRADQEHCKYRRYPLMSLFIDDCLAKAKDVCAGGARYNLTGCVVAGLPNIVNSLAAIRRLVFEDRAFSMETLLAALRANFKGYEKVRQQLLAAPKWGNDLPEVDSLSTEVADRLYAELAPHRNARGGRWQLALYSFICNLWMGERDGATADGRLAGEMLTRNLNPTWGTDRLGPTAILKSLSHIDFSTSPDGSSLDLRFDPVIVQTPENRQAFIGFLKAFVNLKIMEMQISVVDTESLIDARAHPEKYPHLLVRVAGYSARFIDLPPEEQDELIGRSTQRI
jgi:pyruvate-formate lyase